MKDIINREISRDFGYYNLSNLWGGYYGEGNRYKYGHESRKGNGRGDGYGQGYEYGIGDWNVYFDKRGNGKG